MFWALTAEIPLNAFNTWVIRYTSHLQISALYCTAKWERQQKLRKNQRKTFWSQKRQIIKEKVDFLPYLCLLWTRNLQQEGSSQAPLLMNLVPRFEIDPTRLRLLNFSHFDFVFSFQLSLTLHRVFTSLSLHKMSSVRLLRSRKTERWLTLVKITF